MTRKLMYRSLVALLCPMLGAGIGLLAARFRASPPGQRSFVIEAHKYAYEPEVIRVNHGDHIQLRLVAKDVTHGFYLEGYDLDVKVRPENPTFWVRHPSQGEDYEEVSEIRFVADRMGKFRYRCSITCGYMHPFMQGELIVEPNYLYPVSLGLTGGLALAALWLWPLGRWHNST